MDIKVYDFATWDYYHIRLVGVHMPAHTISVKGLWDLVFFVFVFFTRLVVEGCVLDLTYSICEYRGRRTKKHKNKIKIKKTNADVVFCVSDRYVRRFFIFSFKGGWICFSMTCTVSEAEPGLVPQGPLLQPIVCTQELERSKPCEPRGREAKVSRAGASKQGNSDRSKFTGQCHG